MGRNTRKRLTHLALISIASGVWLTMMSICLAYLLTMIFRFPFPVIVAMGLILLTNHLTDQPLMKFTSKS